MWGKPFWSLGLDIFEAIVIGFEMRREYRQFAVVPGLGRRLLRATRRCLVQLRGEFHWDTGVIAHNLIVPSSLAEASVFPSGLQATLVTQSR